MIRGLDAFRNAGFAIHWLQPRSKKPMGVDGRGTDWSTAPVASLEDLKRTYRDGMNVGIRLGEPSRTPAGYLYLLDIDIRVDGVADEAWAALRALLPDVDIQQLPCVASGSGGESRHLYFTAERAFSGKKLAVSEGKHRRETHDPKTGEVKLVWSYDWEIDLFGTDRQAVMPPSIHPDTGQPYTWERGFDFDLLDLGLGPNIPASTIEALGVAETAQYAFELRDPLTFEPGQLEKVLRDVPMSCWDDYFEWIKIGQALHHQFGADEEGFNLWVEHSRRSKHFKESDIRDWRKKWRGFGKNRKQPVTMGTIVTWASEARDAAFSAELADAFDDLDDEVVEDDEDPLADVLGGAAEEVDPLSDDYVSAADRREKAAAEAAGIDLDWLSLLDRSEDKGDIKNTQHNADLILLNDPRLRGLAMLNEFTHETVQRYNPGTKEGRKRAAKPTRQLAGRAWKVKDTLNGELWSDDRDFAIRSIIDAPKSQGGYGYKISLEHLRAAVVNAANANSFHPVREYLEKTTWDGKPRVESLFVDYLGAPNNAYTRDIARMMLVAAVTRIYEPGHKFDFVVILEGLQGRRKSTFIQTLGRNWFGELNGNFDSPQQMIELMQGKWIMEVPELSGMTRADVRNIKAFISTQSDRARLAYARRAGDFPRQCIFIGSTNDREYLKDDSGGRRFWPMLCTVDSIDIDRLQANVDQLWAEAVHLYHQMRAAQPHGTLPLYLTDAEAQVTAARLQESRRVESADDGLAGRIEAWLAKPTSSGGFDDEKAEGPRNHTCLMEIWCEVMGGDVRSYNPATAQSLGRTMRKVEGWTTEGKLHSFPAPYGRQRVYERIGSTGRNETWLP